jgi:hypothetical protein
LKDRIEFSGSLVVTARQFERYLLHEGVKRS